MIKRHLSTIVCILFGMLLLYQMQQMITLIKVDTDTLENINTGYRPDIARHIAEVDNGVIEPDSLYIMLMED